MTNLTDGIIAHDIVIGMSDKKVLPKTKTTQPAKFDKQAYLKAAEKVAKILQKEKTHR
jgi:hypothetical protein